MTLIPSAWRATLQEITCRLLAAKPSGRMASSLRCMEVISQQSKDLNKLGDFKKRGIHPNLYLLCCWNWGQSVLACFPSLDTASNRGVWSCNQDSSWKLLGGRELCGLSCSARHGSRPVFLNLLLFGVFPKEPPQIFFPNHSRPQPMMPRYRRHLFMCCVHLCALFVKK